MFEMIILSQECVLGTYMYIEINTFVYEENRTMTHPPTGRETNSLTISTGHSPYTQPEMTSQPYIEMCLHNISALYGPSSSAISLVKIQAIQ